MNFLDGYKMYIIAAVVVIVGVSEGLLGVDIPGVVVGPDWLGWILAGLGIGAAKSAIAKTAP